MPRNSASWDWSEINVSESFSLFLFYSLITKVLNRLLFQVQDLVLNLISHSLNKHELGYEWGRGAEYLSKCR